MTDKDAPEKPETPGMAEVSPKFVGKAEAAAAKAAMADKPVPQDTLIPLLDAPVDDLATYLAGDSWEARKRYLNNMMGGSIDSLTAYVDVFQQEGKTSEPAETGYIEFAELCVLGLHVKIGQLLDVWDEPEWPNEHAAALYSLSAKSAHRHAMAKWMPGGATSPPAEAELFETTSPLAIFRRLSLMLRPGLSECWRRELEEISAKAAPNQDAQLERLAADYYAAYIARDAADVAREEVEHQAEKLDSEAIRIEIAALSLGGPNSFFLPFMFDKAGTLTPTREQVSQYCGAEKLTEAVMRHLEEYGERCIAALEAQGWPEKHAEYEHAEQRMGTLFDQMVQTPAQGPRGIAAKVRGLVFPHEWEFLRDGKLDDFDDQINTEMLVSLVSDVERLAGEAAPIGATSVIEDPVLVLKREWEARYKALDEHRDDPNTDDSDEAVQPFYDRLHETEVQILRTQATTPAGIAIKLILWARLHCNADEVSGLSWTRKSIEGDPHDLDRLPVLSALLDLESMSSGAVAPETPTQDAALFDAIAEYDRLVTIQQGLERRADVFRDGTPEGEEATKAQEATWDEVLAAWKVVQSIPATTQAGLFARLQATDRFMSHLQEDDLYDEDWCIIKADVQRITAAGGSEA